MSATTALAPNLPPPQRSKGASVRITDPRRFATRGLLYRLPGLINAVVPEDKPLAQQMSKSKRLGHGLNGTNPGEGYFAGPVHRLDETAEAPVIANATIQSSDGARRDIDLAAAFEHHDADPEPDGGSTTLAVFASGIRIDKPGRTIAKKPSSGVLPVPVLQGNQDDPRRHRSGTLTFRHPPPPY